MSLPLDHRTSPLAGAGGDVPGEPSPPTVLESPRPSRRLEVACAVVALALSLGLLAAARGVDVRTETGGIDPRWWPQLLGMAGTALSVALLATALLRPPFPREDLMTATPTGLRRLVLTLLACAALVVVWPLVGFAPAALVFVVALTALFGGRGWRTLLLFPALLTGFLYVLFAVLLEVPL
jgi:hypothetical protein